MNSTDPKPFRYAPSHWRRTIFWIGLAFLAAAVVAAAHSVAIGLPPLVSWRTGEAAAASAGFATVAAIFLGLFQFQHQDLSTRSKFALDMATEGVKRAHHVIGSGLPTRNVAWVNGARLLLRAQTLAENISESDHRDAWNLFHEEWRIRFYDFLRCSVRYYFGTGQYGEYEKDLHLDELTIEQILTESERSTEVVIEGFSSSSSFDTVIGERAIRVVYEFAIPPEDWENPLREREGFTAAQIDDLDMHDMNGLLAFIKIRRGYRLVDGKVKKRPPEEGPQ